MTHVRDAFGQTRAATSFSTTSDEGEESIATSIFMAFLLSATTVENIYAARASRFAFRVLRFAFVPSIQALLTKAI
jgi:hypothetical protein